MRKNAVLLYVVLILVAVLLWFVPANAASVTLDWDEVPGATVYRIEMSLDQGVTWQTPVEAKTKPFVYPDVPEDRLVLFRIGAYNNFGQTVTRHIGAWFDQRKLLPVTKGLSVH